MIDEVLKHCPNSVSTEKMGYDKWLELRKGSIGGSDAGPLCNMPANGAVRLLFFFKRRDTQNRKRCLPPQREGRYWSL